MVGLMGDSAFMTPHCTLEKSGLISLMLLAELTKLV